MSFEVYIYHDACWGWIFAFHSLEAAKTFGDRHRPDHGSWKTDGPDKWTRGEYQTIVRRQVE